MRTSAEAVSQPPPPEVIIGPCTPRLPIDPAGALPNASGHNEYILPPIVPMEPEDRQPEPEIDNLSLRIDNLSLN